MIYRSLRSHHISLHIPSNVKRLPLLESSLYLVFQSLPISYFSCRLLLKTKESVILRNKNLLVLLVQSSSAQD